MKAGKARISRPILQPLLAQQVRIRGLRPISDWSISVNGLDAGIRALAVGTVMLLSLLGRGSAGVRTTGPWADPVLIAAGLVLYNALIVIVLGVPWRRSPGFGLFVLDWAVVSAALILTGGLFSPFLILYYALIIGAALRVGLSKSLILVGACAAVYATLSMTEPVPDEAIHVPVLAVGLTSMLMVAVTAVAMRHAVEVEVRKAESEEHTGAQLRLLNNLTRVVMSGSPDLGRVMRTVAVVSSQAVGADSGLAVLFEHGADGQTGQRDRVASAGSLIVAGDEPNPARLSLSQQVLAERAVASHAPVVEEEIPAGDLHHYPGLAREGVQPRAVACVPFLLSGEVIGVLFVGRHAPPAFSDTELDLLTAIAQQMALAVRLARLYENERQRAAASEQRELMERDLLSMVSHELRTPLTSIKTCASTLSTIESTGDGDGPEARLLHNIERSTDRLIVLVNELLEMARLRAGRVSLNMQRLNMAEIIIETAQQVRPLLDARKQTLYVDLPERGSTRWNALYVDADRRRLEQVLLNLLSNANKYAPEGSAIVLGATPRDGKVKVFVRDDGPGIEQAEQERIFEKFYRGQAEMRQDGTGLGLAIARSLVELHGGQIAVQSRPGKGSTFYFVLPACSETPGQVAGRPIYTTQIVEVRAQAGAAGIEESK